MVHRRLITCAEWVVKHQVPVFIAVFLVSLFLTRLIASTLVDFETSIFGFHLHHYYYGLSLLIFTSLLMLFGPRHYLVLYPLYLGLVATSLGLITDEMPLIGVTAHGRYYSVLPLVLLAAAIIIGIVLLIHYVIGGFESKK